MRSIALFCVVLSLLVSLARAAETPVRLVKVEAHYVEIRNEKIPERLRAGPASTELAAYLWGQIEAYSRDARVLASASVIAEDGQEAASDSRKWRAFATVANQTTQPATGPATRPIVTLAAEPYSEGVLFRVHPRLADDNAIRAQLEFSFVRVDRLVTISSTPISSVVMQSAIPQSSDVSIQTNTILRPQTPQILGSQTVEDVSTFFLVRASVLRVQ